MLSGGKWILKGAREISLVLKSHNPGFCHLMRTKGFPLNWQQRFPLSSPLTTLLIMPIRCRLKTILVDNGSATGVGIRQRRYAFLEKEVFLMPRKRFIRESLSTAL